MKSSHLVAYFLSIFGFATQAISCDDSTGDRLSFSDEEFKSAAEVFESDAPGYLRAGAYATMLRSDEPLFSALIKEGKKSDDSDIRDAAILCEVMRARGFTVAVTGQPKTGHSLSEAQLNQMTSYSQAPKVVSRHFEEACLSTYKPKEQGCNPTYNISVAGGVVSYRSDRHTGTFVWVDNEYQGTVSLVYGGPVLELPAKLQVH